MANPTRSAAELNAYITAYSENYLNSTPLNQAWTKTPLLDLMLSDAQEADGGNELVVPVMDGANTNGDAFGAGSTLNLTQPNPFTQARYQFVQEYAPMYIDDVVWDKATGGGAKLNLLENILDYARLGMKEQVCAHMCAASTGAAPDGSTRISSIISYIDSTGAVGGLNPSTPGQSWWAASETNSIGSFNSNGPAYMRSTYLAITKYQRLGTPDAIICSTTAYQAYEASGLNLYTKTGDKPGTLDIGAGNLQYKGIPIIYEPHLDALEATLGGVMLWINKRAIKLVPRAGKVFTMKPWTDMLPAQKAARASALFFTGQVVMQGRSCLAKGTGITL